MSYLRWLYATQYAKIARRGNGFVDTVNAFRHHRQQKTLACEAAVKARAEFWSRLSESFRRLRTGQPNFLRKALPSQDMHQSAPTDGNVHKSGATTVQGSGNFRSMAKQIVTFILRGRQELSSLPKVSSLSPLLERSLCQTRESIGNMLQLQKQHPKSQELQELRVERQPPPANSSSKICLAKPRKPLAMFFVSRNCPWTERKSSCDIQQNTQKVDQKTSAATNKPTEDPALAMYPSTCPQSECKRSTRSTISNQPQCDPTSSEKEKAMLLPERPNILVLSEINNNGMSVDQPSASINELFQQICKNVIQEKESHKPFHQLPAPASCKMPTLPAHCILPPQAESPVTLMVTNVLDKYKIISLPAGRAIPGQPKRQIQIEIKNRQNETKSCSQPALRRRKV